MLIWDTCIEEQKGPFVANNDCWVQVCFMPVSTRCNLLLQMGYHWLVRSILWQFMAKGPTNRSKLATPDLFQGVSYGGKTIEDVRCSTFLCKHDRGKTIHQWLLVHLEIIFYKVI